MCLYLSLSALHVSDSLVHHQEKRFGAVYRNWYKPLRLAVVRLYRHKTCVGEISPHSQLALNRVVF